MEALFPLSTGLNIKGGFSPQEYLLFGPLPGNKVGWVKFSPDIKIIFPMGGNWTFFDNFPAEKGFYVPVEVRFMAGLGGHVDGRVFCGGRDPFP